MLRGRAAERPRRRAAPARVRASESSRQPGGWSRCCRAAKVTGWLSRRITESPHHREDCRRHVGLFAAGRSSRPPGRRAAGAPCRRVAWVAGWPGASGGGPGGRIAGWPRRGSSGSSGRRTAGSRSRLAAGSPSRQSAEPAVSPKVRVIERPAAAPGSRELVGSRAALQGRMAEWVGRGVAGVAEWPSRRVGVAEWPCRGGPVAEPLGRRKSASSRDRRCTAAPGVAMPASDRAWPDRWGAHRRRRGAELLGAPSGESRSGVALPQGLLTWGAVSRETSTSPRHPAAFGIHLSRIWHARLRFHMKN